jgi:two-component system NtrC family sensor kinase
MLAKQPVDVVVMDVMMPGISGIDALFKIKKRYHETEVILLTGNANTQDGVEGIKSGAFDYLTKPVEFEHLLGKIVQAYDKIISDREQKSGQGIQGPNRTADDCHGETCSPWDACGRCGP